MRHYLRILTASALIMTVVIGGYRLLFGSGGEDSIEAFAGFAESEDRVSSLQEALRREGAYQGEVSGRFDSETEDALRRWQRENGFPPSGVPTPESLAALGIGTEIEELLAYEEERILASAVDAICPDGEYLTRIALAGVILRRTETPGFPDTVAAVVFGDRRFAAVLQHDFTTEPSEDSRCAVRDARLGLSPCPEALYYYVRGEGDPFLLKKPILYRNGKHCFA